MQTNEGRPYISPNSPWDKYSFNRSDNRLFKDFITCGLVLLLLIAPFLFISNMIQERQQRQADSLKEASNHWAGSQTLTGPYLEFPYKIGQEVHHLILLPENMAVTCNVTEGQRQPPILKGLLYQAALSMKGNFIFQLPTDIQPDSVQYKKARICFGLSDLTGIEDRLTVTFNGVDYGLAPDSVVASGNEELSASIPFTPNDLGRSIAFGMDSKIKGNEQLHFLPFCDSYFVLRSDWSDLSFDGKNPPMERTVTDKGVAVIWKFKKDRLPFSTVLKDAKPGQNNTTFGITLMPPADGYAKIDQCIKYAVVCIGWTFALFFIAGLMKDKPLHPVQYVFIGIGQTIFYSLLLALAEIVSFGLAYGISSLATILLISFYAKLHFESWRVARLAGTILLVLYVFIFVLIQSEDKALLIGTIGLFLTLAIVMYISDKINWRAIPNRAPLQPLPDH